jgi:poly-gamma-glutamate synthesis protein (capsule biosynthesis protein)
VENAVTNDDAFDSPAGQAPSPHDSGPDDPRPVTLALVGDCMLGRLVDEVLESAPPEYPWGDTLDIFRSADWRMCNLECVISDCGTPWAAFEKAFHFRSAAKNIAALKAAGMNAVSIANNHVLDYDVEAMEEMLKILDGAGIVHAGAGKNLNAASRMAKACIRNRKLGIVAFTDNEPGWEAGASQAGVFYVPTDLKDARAQRLLEIVCAHRNEVDYLIVSAHWGSNWGYVPPADHVAFAHALIDAGAGIIFGHSCHVFRGIEFYGGRPILYSAGNFVDDYAVDPVERNDRSFICMVELQERGLPRLRLHPTVIRRCQARKAKRIDELAIVQKLQELCAPFHSATRWDEAGRYLELRCPGE